MRFGRWASALHTTAIFRQALGLASITASMKTNSNTARNCVRGVLMAALVGATVAACSDSSDAGDFGGIGGNAAGTGGSTASGGSGSGPLPPELELEESFRSPVVTGAFVWSANPDSNRVARIDARNLQIEVFDAGHAPTYLAALPAGKTAGGALVINQKSDDASLFLIAGGDAGSDTDPAISVKKVSLQAGASAWAVGSTGRVAIAWSRAEDALLGSDDGYQDITILSFDDEVRADTLSVGFRPSRVVIAQDETRGFVVSDPGISVLDLTAGTTPSILREIFLPEAALGLERDVSFSSTGQFAFVRLEGSSQILIVDTATDARVTVEFPGIVTDLDLSANGEIGVAVMRASDVTSFGEGGAGEPSSSAAAVFSVDELVLDATAFELVTVADVVGSAEIAEDGSLAVLYTNALSSSFLWVLKLDDHALRRVDVRAPILAALVSVTGDHAVTIQKPPAGSVKAGAFAVVPLRENLPARIEGTDAVPAFVSIAKDGSAAVVTTLAPEGSPSASYLTQLPGFRVDTLRLPSTPLASGIVASAGKAFVAQKHPEGRISFINLGSGQATTVTGFELGSKVVHE